MDIAALEEARILNNLKKESEQKEQKVKHNPLLDPPEPNPYLYKCKVIYP